MKFYKLSHKGEFHVNYNEDFLVSEEAGKYRQLIAVMDGCSSGTDSHFANQDLLNLKFNFPLLKMNK